MSDGRACLQIHLHKQWAYTSAARINGAVCACSPTRCTRQSSCANVHAHQFLMPSSVWAEAWELGTLVYETPHSWINFPFLLPYASFSPMPSPPSPNQPMRKDQRHCVPNPQQHSRRIPLLKVLKREFLRDQGGTTSPIRIPKKATDQCNQCQFSLFWGQRTDQNFCFNVVLQ